MADASSVRSSDSIQLTTAAAVAAYELRQLADGRAAVFNSVTAAASGDRLTYTASGQWTIPKTASISLLDGGRAYWDHSGRAVHFKKVADQDFYLGRVVGDAAAADANCVVNLNVDPPYDLDLSRDPFTSLAVLTAGTPSITRRGGAHLLAIDNTNEAEKIDALGDDGFATSANAIIEAAVKVTADDSGTAAIFSLGIASATHATAFTSITNSIGIQVKAHDLKIYAESKTGSVTVAPTDTTKAYVVGTRFEVWIDTRNPAACAIYVDGVRVLTLSVFDVSASVVNWFLLAHLVKTATTDTMTVQVDWLRARFAEQ